VLLGPWAERSFGRKDPQVFVLDEAIGYWIAVAPFVDSPRAATVMAGFLLFRCFDILKPWPARRLERLPAGWGVILDDVAAGLYALIGLACARALGWL